MSRRLAALALATLLLHACATSTNASGRPLPQKKAARIAKGQTTKDQILEWFGAPTSQSEIGGDMVYVYRDSKRTGSAFRVGDDGETSGKEQSDALAITFDKQTGSVETFSIQRGIDA